MTFLPESAVFTPGVTRLELFTPVLGGEGGPSNLPLQELTNRTRWLREQVTQILTQLDSVEGQLDPTLRADLANAADGFGAQLVAFRRAGAEAVSREVRSVLRDQSVSALDFGLDNTGATPVTDAFIAMLNERPAGKGVRFPAGTYLIEEKVEYVLTSDLDIHLEPGAVLLGDPSVGTEMLRIRGSSGTSVPQHTFRLFGGQIDNGDRPFVSADASGTCLALTDVKRWHVQGTIFGRETRGWRDDKGDSGISTVRSPNGTVIGCWFYGQPDLGIYLSGTATPTDITDDYGDVSIIGNHFIRCRSACSAKRLAARTTFIGNTVLECDAGYSALETGTAGIGIDSGNTHVVVGNAFKKLERYGVRLQAGGDGSVIANNTFEDFGYDYNNTITVGGIAYGVWLRGSKRCIVNGNVFRFKDWDPVPLSARAVNIVVADSELTGVVYTPEKNLICNNVFTGFRDSPREDLESIGNVWVNNVISDAEPEPALLGSTSYYSIFDVGNPTEGWRHYYGNVAGVPQEIFKLAPASDNALFCRGFRFFDAPDKLVNMKTLSTIAVNFGTVNANSTKEVTVAGLTGLTPNHTLSFNVAANAINPGISYQIYCVTADEVICQAINPTGANVNVGAVTFRAAGWLFA